MISIITALSGVDYLERYKLTLRANVLAAIASGVDFEFVLCSYGDTLPGLDGFLRSDGLFSRVRHIHRSDTTDCGVARNAALAAATGAIVINLDCDNYLRAHQFQYAAEFFARQEVKSCIFGPGRRGDHGRVAFFADELRAIGGFSEGYGWGTSMEMEDLRRRASAEGMTLGVWPRPSLDDFIKHKNERCSKEQRAIDAERLRHVGRRGR